MDNPRKEEIIKRAIKIHGDKYNYDLINFKLLRDKVDIKCLSCDRIFPQRLYSHLEGRGCRKCANKHLSKIKTKSQEDYIKEAKEKYGDQYDYSKAIYTNNKNKIIIICNIHKLEFKQRPDVHLTGQGCYECGKERTLKKATLTQQQFLDRVKSNKNYDYKDTIYTGSRNLITILCLKCNEKFDIIAQYHIYQSIGCQNCRVKSKGEEKVKEILQELDLKYKPQFSFPNTHKYFDFGNEIDKKLIEYDGIQHFEEDTYFPVDLEEQHEIDIEKTRLALKHGYQIIRIPYTIKLDKIKEQLIPILSSNKQICCLDKDMYTWLFDGLGIEHLVEHIIS